jgi:hypothetical protein
MLSVRKLVFAGALLAVVPFAAVAQDAPKAAPKPMPPAATGPAPSGTVVTPAPGTVHPAPGAVVAPGTPCPPQTMRVCKMVPTQVQETRTVMKQVQRQECYTAYRTETVREKKCVPCTTYQTVTETVMENRTKCIKVPCMETKTVMEKRKRYEYVTEYKNKCKIRWEKECKTIGGHGLFDKCCDKLTSCFGDKCGHGCGSSGCGNDCGGLSLSVPVWKPRVETECVPVCRKKCVYDCVPVTKQVCTYKTQTVTECVPVCKKRCVPVTTQKEVEVCRQVCVPYQATRCVTECVPVCETVTVCKMVPTWVDVPCPAPAQACPPACPPGAGAQGCPNPCDAGHGAGKGGCCLFDKFDSLKCDLHGKFDSFKCHFSGLCDKFSCWGDKFSGCFSGFCCK